MHQNKGEEIILLDSLAPQWYCLHFQKEGIYSEIKYAHKNEEWGFNDLFIKVIKKTQLSTNVFIAFIVLILDNAQNLKEEKEFANIFAANSFILQKMEQLTP